MKRALRVLIVARPDASERFGGDTMLARETLAAIRDLGIDAALVETDRPSPRGYDVAHLFNVGQPHICKRQIEACREAGVPIVLSPVWLDLRELYGRARMYEHLFLHAKSRAAIETKLRSWRRPRDPWALIDRRRRKDLERRLALQSELLRSADVLLPNSAIEARDCLVQLGVREKPLIIIRIPANLEPAQFWKERRQGLVAVGRVETRKNQTALLYALRDEPLQIDIVGAAFDPGLERACLEWCPRARFHGRVDRQALLGILGQAEVHALVSWCETAGIATLEAAAAGAKIVVGDRGAEVEYFGDDAEYADPADPDSIRAAVVRAFKRPPRYRGDRLDQRIRQCTWRLAGQETLRAYFIAMDISAAGNKYFRGRERKAGEPSSVTYCL